MTTPCGSIAGGVRRAGGNRGFTLIEVLIVLAVASALLFGVFALASRVQEQSVASQAAQNLNMMVADARGKFRSQGNFNGVSVQALIDNRIPPESMIQGNQIINGWNGQVQVQPATLNTANDSIQLTYQDVNSESCPDFVQAAEGSFTRITVGGTLVKTQGNTLSVPQLGANCGNATVDISFTQPR